MPCVTQSPQVGPQSDDDNIKVVVRVRPLNPQEQAKGAASVVQVAEDCSSLQVVVPGPGGATMKRDFSFHACLGPDVSQAEVMDLCGIHQLLDAALAGYHVTIFAYGQTGARVVAAGPGEGCASGSSSSSSAKTRRRACMQAAPAVGCMRSCSPQLLPSCHATSRPHRVHVVLPHTQALARRTRCRAGTTTPARTALAATSMMASSRAPCSTSSTRCGLACA